MTAAATVRQLPAITAVLLVAAQICYPLTADTARDLVIVTIVLLLAATALTHAWVTGGLPYALGVLVIVSGLGLIVEIIGTAHGFPFGCYHYAHGRLGPELGGVPLVVPLAWTGGLYPVWVVAGLLSRRAGRRIPLTALGAVGWDLFLDPQMVADGQWSWCSPHPGLPGLAYIPWTNYLGWVANTLIIALCLLPTLRFGGAQPAGAVGRLRRTLPTIEYWGNGRLRLDMGSVVPSQSVAVPVAVFLWTWLGCTLAQAVFLHLPASALYGFLGMGTLGIPLLWRWIRPPTPKPASSRRSTARRVRLGRTTHGTM